MDPRCARSSLPAALILVGYWAAFALYPLPPPGFDTTTVGVRADWPHHVTGFAAHWDKNTNLAARVDQWFLNLFPRERPFVYNGGGYLTLNFVPSLATMIFGLLAGGVLRSARAGPEKLRVLITWGVGGIAAWRRRSPAGPLSDRQAHLDAVVDACSAPAGSRCFWRATTTSSI